MREKNNFMEQIEALCESIHQEYQINSELYQNPNIKLGLRNHDGTGVIAGVTKIASVEGYVLRDGKREAIPGKLYYRGIDIEEIVNAHRKANTFGYEEVAYLLLLGKLPTKAQLELFNSILASARKLPEGFNEDVILKTPSKNIMNKLARSVLSLYSYDDNPDDTSIANVLRQSVEIIGRLPVIAANAYMAKRHYYDGRSLHIHNAKEHLSLSENFLRMLRTHKNYTDEEAKLLDLMLILHAEHGGGNNSAFVCRAVSSTGTDTYSAIAAAIGSLKGPLHGGANAKVMEMFNDAKAHIANPNDEGQVRDYLYRVLKKEANDRSGLIYGMGHAVYTISDPRAVLLKKYARELAEKTGMYEDLQLLERIEKNAVEMIPNFRKRDVPVCANVDLYSGLIYQMLRIPADMYTPIFAVARISGWCAHRIEEIYCKRIMRPAYKSAFEIVPYVAPEMRE